MVLLEAGFGRDHGDFVFPPNLPEAHARSLPRRPAKGLTVMTAAAGEAIGPDDVGSRRLPADATTTRPASDPWRENRAQFQSQKNQGKNTTLDTVVSQ